MSGFLVDTNVPSELVRSRPASKVETWLDAQDLDTLFISAVSFGELRKGTILMSPGRRRTELESWIEADLSILFSGRILSVHAGDSRTLGRIGRETTSRGSALEYC